MCLCGMLAAEYETLPGPIGDAVVDFFDMNEIWLTRVLERGRAEGSLQFAGSAKDASRMLISGLEGAMLVARPYGDLKRFQSAARRLLASLAAPAPALGLMRPRQAGRPFEFAVCAADRRGRALSSFSTGPSA